MERLKGIGIDPRIMEWADKIYKEQEPYHRPNKGGTGIKAYTTGDLLYASDANTLAKLAIGTSAQYLTVSGGLPAWATLGYKTVARCRVTQSAGQALTGAAWNTLTWDTETYDVTGFHSTSSNTNRLVAPETGVYLISLGVDTATATSGYVEVTLNNTGAAGIIARQAITAAALQFTTVLSFVYVLSANDWVSAEVYPGVNATTAGATFFSAVKIGE
jgi:hypothetical protein